MQLMGLIYNPVGIPMMNIFRSFNIAPSSGDGAHTSGAPCVYVANMVAHIDTIGWGNINLAASQVHSLWIWLGLSHMVWADYRGSTVHQI
jgi:hypothetical protein